MRAASRRVRPLIAGIAAAVCFAGAGLAAGPGFAADGQVPPMPQPGDGMSVLEPLTASPAETPTTAGLTQALAGPLSTKGLGPDVHVAVWDTASGTLLYDQNAGSAAIPASTNKLLSAAAALTAYGADYRLTTRVVRGAGDEIVLVGSGDPTLQLAKPAAGGPQFASLTKLADETAAELKKAAGGTAPTVTLRFDDSLFTGPTTSPTWPSVYVTEGLVSRITALLVNDGFVAGVSADPALAATQKFAGLLKARGIVVTGAPARTTATAEAAEVARVYSAPMSAAVQHTLESSDNTQAEMLAHLAGVKLGGAGSFDGGVAAVTKVLTDLGIPTDGLRLFDGSGLSRENAIPPRLLGQLLNAIAANKNPELWAVSYGMPIAGFTGTLDNRFVLPATKPGRGEVRAKTGSLTGVSTLAGLITDASGDLLTFVFMAPATPDYPATVGAWDRAAAALAQCGCK